MNISKKSICFKSGGESYSKEWLLKKYKQYFPNLIS